MASQGSSVQAGEPMHTPGGPGAHLRLTGADPERHQSAWAVFLHLHELNCTGGMKGVGLALTRTGVPPVQGGHRGTGGGAGQRLR